MDPLFRRSALPLLHLGDRFFVCGDISLQQLGGVHAVVVNGFVIEQVFKAILCLDIILILCYSIVNRSSFTRWAIIIDPTKGSFGYFYFMDIYEIVQ